MRLNLKGYAIELKYVCETTMMRLNIGLCAWT